MIKFSKSFTKVKYEIETQGKPVLNSLSIYRQSNDILLLEIDMKSKYCEVSGHMSSYIGKDDYIPGILIGITPETLHLDNTREDDFTSVQFPDLKGWSIFSTYAGRYTIRICLVKEK